MVVADGGHGTSPGPAGSPNVAYTPADLDYRHSGQLIVAFADGHVASLKDFNFGWAKAGELTAANDQNFTGAAALVVDANAPLTGKPAMTLPSTFQSGTLKQMAVGKYGYAIFNWQNYGDSVLNIQAPYTAVTKSASGWANDQYCKFEYKIGANSYGGKALYANKVASISVTLSDFDEHIITILSPAKFADTRKFAVTVTSESGAAKESILSYDWTVQNHTRGKVLQVIIHSSAKITISVPNGTADCGTFSSVFLD